MVTASAKAPRQKTVGGTGDSVLGDQLRWPTYMVGRSGGCGVMGDLHHLCKFILFYSEYGRKQERQESGWNSSRTQQRCPALVDLQ